MKWYLKKNKTQNKIRQLKYIICQNENSCSY